MESPTWLLAAAARRPDHAAVVTPRGSLSYAELLDGAMAASRALAARGAGPGTRVAIALEPGLEFLAALHGCWLLGGMAVPVDRRLSAAERAVRSANALLVEAPLGPPFGGQAGPELGAPTVRESHDTGAVAAVMYTSGSSAEPKPVELTFANWEASAAGSAAIIGHEPGERWLCALPLAHVGGLSIVIRSVIHATTAILHPRFEAEAAVRATMEDGVTMVSVVPTTLGRLLDAGLRDPPDLRCALVGGAPAPARLVERAAAAGVPVAQTYGLTEACSQVATSDIGASEAVGRLLPETAVSIAENGEILVEGATVAPGALSPDGVLHTGDLGRFDSEGRLVVTGRLSEVIVSGGENIAPVEVEAALVAHPAVADAGVWGRPDPEWGEAVVAAVVLEPGASVGVAELQEHCAAGLARFKAPKSVVFVGELPRTPSGKLARRQLPGVV